MSAYLLDTNAVIDFFNNKLPVTAANFIEGIEPQISVITAIELFASASITQNERQQLEKFLSIATIYDKIDINIIMQTIALRQAYKTKLPDAIIAATALVYNLTLVTRNTDDFKNVAGLKTVNPHSL